MYVVDEDPNTVVQYSVAQDWATKIRSTVTRIKETMPATRALIYATNQVIGPDADSLVRELRRDDRISLDIRDRNWFIDRELTYSQREVASAELAQRFVDPLLVGRGVRSFVSPALGKDEARVALVHLALEGEDRHSEKGWTKSCFEALVLSTLHGTSNESRIERTEIVNRVSELLPSGYDTQISQQVDGALARLSRRGGPVKPRGGSYALSFAESEELNNRLASFALQEEALKRELVAAVKLAAPRLETDLDDNEWLAVAESLRLGLEVILLARGEEFALTVTTGEVHQANAQEVLAQVTASVHNSAAGLTDEEATAAIIEILERPSVNLRNHLRRLADAYSMYAFLRQTPDVQRAVLTIFTGGDLWLDTSVILPLFAEILLEDPAERRYTTILRAALDAGLHLYVTAGVVEEVEAHLNVSLACARTDSSAWRSSRIPFLFAAYTLAGRGRGQFAAWLERFRGQRRPMDDIIEYLADTHAIDLRGLQDEADRADPEIRAAVQEIWYEAHERRRGPNEEMDALTMGRLVAHDVENCLGVIQLRQATPASPMGYRQWYLTLDKTAWSLKRELTERLGRASPESPALSPDFMTQYLRLAPVRSAVERELWASLPLITDVSRYEYVPKDFIERADEIRRQVGDMDERIIRRRVRDTLDEMKRERGPQAFAGVAGAERELNQQITQSRDRTQQSPR
ncbi:MAG TPA: hypothetical protein VMU94_24045 [Streptosporangiaceae bacterium]|nr:hypothetical protein [Streptosporangiaceae bacterium]